MIIAAVFASLLSLPIIRLRGSTVIVRRWRKPGALVESLGLMLTLEPRHVMIHSDRNG